ncbi:hypothetical protein E2C01_075921 [Portunus trituberculatus]|uniref:Uncharacterized protein n=1 Tax=Portunus trituberculatus TaxID=210409 RepID=A0A5B7IG67_PORTR|nr:hypothetical protein [Portunus trituberculatus]
MCISLEEPNVKGCWLVGDCAGIISRVPGLHVYRNWEYLSTFFYFGLRLSLLMSAASPSQVLPVPNNPAPRRGNAATQGEGVGSVHVGREAVGWWVGGLPGGSRSEQSPLERRATRA